MQSKPDKGSRVSRARFKRPTFATAALSLVVYASTLISAQAESLSEALSTAYLYNPTLKSARAQLRATDENVARAKSGFRPTVTGQADHSYTHVETKPPSAYEGDSYPRNYSVTLSQPLFSGFRSINAVKGAEAGVEAGREDLRSAEQQVLLDAVTYYVNVVRDQALLNLQENNLKVLDEQLKATQDRFDVGEVTKTDVAQARARSSGATSQISAARANLQTSRAGYAQVIGRSPGTLRDPGPARRLPKTLEQALQIGERENPSIIAAIFRERAQEHAVKQARGELLPSLNLQAGYTRSFDGSVPGREDVTTVTGVLTVPIYEAGEVSARIRQGVETQSQLRHQIDAAREQVHANVISAWGTYTAARAQIRSDAAQVEANRVALAGVKEEEKVGQRTVLDVLNAEQELLNSQVSLTTSKRNLAVASYALLSATGQISAANLELSVEQYDPTNHYRDVSDKWYGWDVDVEPSETAPKVAPVKAKGKTADQPSGDGPAYREQ
jgi:outer membrane protein